MVVQDEPKLSDELVHHLFLQYHDRPYDSTVTDDEYHYLVLVLKPFVVLEMVVPVAVDYLVDYLVVVVLLVVEIHLDAEAEQALVLVSVFHSCLIDHYLNKEKTIRY
jgi:hypothetical protein